MVATSRTGPDGLAHLAIGELQPDSIVSIASCPEGTAVTDPGTWYVQSQARELLGYVYTVARSAVKTTSSPGDAFVIIPTSEISTIV